MGNFFAPQQQTSQSSSTTTPNSPVASSAMTGLIQQAQNQPTYSPYTGQLTAGLQAPQTQGINYLSNNATSLANPYLAAAAGYANTSAAGVTPQGIAANMNPYTQQVIDATLAQSNQQNQAQQNQLVGSTVGSGGLGNSRLGVMQGVLGGQQAMATNSLLANLNSQNYQQATNTAATNAQLAGQGAFTMGNLGNEATMTGLAGANALMGAGGVQQQTAQAADTAAYQNNLLNYTMPLQLLQGQSGIIDANSMGLGSTTNGTQTTPTASWGQQLLGLGTAALGAFAARGGRINGYSTGGGVAPSGDFAQLTANLAHAVHHLRNASSPQRFAAGGLVPDDFSPNLGDSYAFGPPIGSNGLPPPQPMPQPQSLGTPPAASWAPSVSPSSNLSGSIAGVVPPYSGSFDNSANPITGSTLIPSDLRRPLIAAGAAIMADRSPSLGAGIGTGIEAGLGQYDKDQQTARQGKLSQAELDQKAADLDARVKEAQGRLKVDSERNAIMAQPRFGYQPGVDANGNPTIIATQTRGPAPAVTDVSGQGQIVGKGGVHGQLSDSEIEKAAQSARDKASALTLQTYAIEAKQNNTPYNREQAMQAAQQAGEQAYLKSKAGYPSGVNTSPTTPTGQPLGGPMGGRPPAVALPAPGQPATPSGQTTGQAAPPGMDQSSMIAAAKQAIAAGKDRDAVINKLYSMGVSATDMGQAGL